MLLTVAWLGLVVAFSVVKTIVGRARPAGPLAAITQSGFAFPSGHSTEAVVVYGTLAYLLVSPSRRRRLWRQAATWFGAGLLAAVVGASRVYLRVHWASDVLGGFALGRLWLAVLVTTTVTLGRHHATADDERSGAGRP